MKVVVIGANGQLGCDVCSEFSACSHQVLELNHDAMDVAELDSVRDSLEHVGPQVVVNCAAMHNVEVCENEPGKAFAVNAIGVRNLAILANELDFLLFHVSTDYVFDGLKRVPYVEDDCPMPLNVYGNTKLAGEHFVQTIARRYFIVRVSGLYGINPCRAKAGANFVNLMLRLAKERDEVRVVDDEVLTPTFTEDVARQIVRMTEMKDYGLYHATAQGSCSWHAFAARIFQFSGATVRLSVADPSEFPLKVPRPKYSVLENSRLKALKMDIMPTWEDGLGRYLEKTSTLAD